MSQPNPPSGTPSSWQTPAALRAQRAAQRAALRATHEQPHNAQTDPGGAADVPSTRVEVVVGQATSTGRATDSDPEVLLQEISKLKDEVNALGREVKHREKLEKDRKESETTAANRQRVIDNPYKYVDRLKEKKQNERNLYYKKEMLKDGLRTIGETAATLVGQQERCMDCIRYCDLCVRKNETGEERQRAMRETAALLVGKISNLREDLEKFRKDVDKAHADVPDPTHPARG